MLLHTGAFRLGRGTCALETGFPEGLKPFWNQLSIRSDFYRWGSEAYMMFLQRTASTQVPLHREGPSHKDGFTQRWFYKGVLLHTGARTHRERYIYGIITLACQGTLAQDLQGVRAAWAPCCGPTLSVRSGFYSALLQVVTAKASRPYFWSLWHWSLR